MHTTSRDGFPGIRRLASFDEVYNALGGPGQICALTGNSRASVWNWRQRQVFPARHYRVIGEALWERGCTADIALFAFSTPKDAEQIITDDVAA
jgi:hypothetical protein